MATWLAGKGQGTDPTAPARQHLPQAPMGTGNGARARLTARDHTGRPTAASTCPRALRRPHVREYGLAATRSQYRQTWNVTLHMLLKKETTEEEDRS